MAAAARRHRGAGARTPAPERQPGGTPAATAVSGGDSHLDGPINPDRHTSPGSSAVGGRTGAPDRPAVPHCDSANAS